MIMFYAPQLHQYLSSRRIHWFLVVIAMMLLPCVHASETTGLFKESGRFMLTKPECCLWVSCWFLVANFLFCLKEYQSSSVLGQFVTRFLLRETSTQLQSLQSSLDCATEAVHDQGCTGRRAPKKPEDLPVQRAAKRPSRRNQKNMCLSPTDPYSGMLTTGRGPAEVYCG